ncbi:MAG TPA: hypothetical protein VGK91_07775 [Candidatus Udaeobacter sp.]|jgi:hypothetical protein
MNPENGRKLLLTLALVVVVMVVRLLFRPHLFEVTQSFGVSACERIKGSAPFPPSF